MKLIVAGSRHVTNYADVITAIERARGEWFPDTRVDEVVSGGAAGADALGERWAERVGIPVRKFPADWAKHGRAAGPLRNRDMAAYADALVAVWDGNSRGTASMIAEAKARGLKVYVHRVTRGAA